MSRHLDSTPRPGPADFPITPQTTAQQARQRLSATIKRQAQSPPSTVTKNTSDSPVIPLSVIDAPSQRLFAFATYGVLQAWKVMDYWSMSGFHETESFWLFMKWVLFDAIFLMGLVSLRIPWLSWSPATMVMVILSHAACDGALMFQIGLPISFLLESLVRLFYDREMAISERRVKPHRIMDHSSLIMGKQVINILPEGSALLNPHNEFFCIGGKVNQVQLPIQINQTAPILIELLRRDFDMDTEEVLTIKSSEAKKLRKSAIDYQKRTKGPLQSQDPLLLRYTVRKPGQYTIHKVVDESKLDVRPRPSEIIVVECPSARIKMDNGKRCKGDLSDVAFEVDGTPPLKIKYRKLVNGNPTEAQFQSIQPDDFESPFSKRHQSALVKSRDADFSWAKSQTVTVPINETMMTLGQYSYTIDEVQDVFGNKVIYSTSLEDDEINRSRHPEISQSIAVHDRPLIWIPKSAGCNSERPLKVASGREADLPHRITSVGKTESDVQYRNDYVFDEDHFIEFDFISEDQLNEDPMTKKIKTYKVKKSSLAAAIPVKEPGLYALKSIWTGHCRGEVSEPSACLLQNPIKPSVKIESSEITHKCANSPIGLRVNFEFEGSPPFTVHYTEDKDGSKKFPRSRTFDGYRGQVELVPNDAGHYRYTFNDIKDNYYDTVKFNEVLHQDVRPSASAHIAAESASIVQNICIGQPASFTIYMLGDAPWTLEYEVIHGKSRKKFTKTDITDTVYHLQVDDIKDGGEYTLSLSSVSDKSGCKEFLKGDAKFQVWSQVPTASFGIVNGKRSAQILEGKSISLPLKFTGQPSFAYSLQNKDTNELFTDAIDHANGAVQVKSPGTYVLTKMQDRYCPGVVDSTAESFVVNWISRPSLSISQHPTVALKGSKYVKQEVCEGEEDFIELALQGTPPFDLTYEEHAKTDDGKSLRKRELNAALGIASIQLDTGKAGQYEYKFVDVSDANYNPHARSRSNIVLQQQVNPRPTARFTNPGKVYSYCTSEGADDSFIQITFTGVPPFDLDVDLRFSGSIAPESITMNNIQTNQYDLRLPQKHLRTGHSHLTIRRVRDGRGCQSKSDTSVAPSRVQISVHDPPQIVPLEAKTDFCVGERISYRLEGVTPFTVFYTFEGSARKATSKKAVFRRLAERPGEFVITGLSDSSSACKFATELQKTIHPLPSVKMSQGRESVVDIHEGGEAEILLEFTGSPPFEFTYTRSETIRGGKKGRVLETKTDRTDEFKVRLRASEEGTYEVISIRDRWCGISKAGAADSRGEKLLIQ